MFRLVVLPCFDLCRSNNFLEGSCKTIYTPITCRTLVCVIVVSNLNHFLVCLYKIIIVNLYVLNNYNILSSTAQDGTSPLSIASQQSTKLQAAIDQFPTI